MREVMTEVFCGNPCCCGAMPESIAGIACALPLVKECGADAVCFFLKIYRAGKS